MRAQEQQDQALSRNSGQRPVGHHGRVGLSGCVAILGLSMIAAKQVEPDVSKRSVELRDSPQGASIFVVARCSIARGQ